MAELGRGRVDLLDVRIGLGAHPHRIPAPLFSNHQGIKSSTFFIRMNEEAKKV